MTRPKREPLRRYVGVSSTDLAFDQLVPDDLRHLSRAHWTPIDVAIRATALIRPTAATRVLDVGAGVGKLCMVGALSAAGTWFGVEHHASLVDAARRLALALGLAGRTRFLHDDAFALDWDDYDVIYLYNPFELPPFPGPRPPRELDVQIARLQSRLASLRPRVRVITFHGFGGAMPASYELLYHERVPVIGLDLVLWTQRAGARSGAVAS